MDSVRLALWNLEWAPPRSKRGSEIRRQLEAAEPDIVCLTESRAAFLENGHQIEAEADYGYPIIADRRKVLLWSRWPWTASDHGLDHKLPPGRYVEGVVHTPIGELLIIGICIPWHSAHVKTGRKDRKKWDEHADYIEALKSRLHSLSARTLVLGDFNQTLPRSRQPASVAEALEMALSDKLEVATRGVVSDTGSPAIDHVAHTRELRVSVGSLLPATMPDGRLLSDHFGMILNVSYSGAHAGARTTPPYPDLK